MSRYALTVLAAAFLLALPARASWVNQMGNGDSNSNYIGVGAASAQLAATCGFVNSGSTPTVLWARTTNGDMWSEGGGFTGYGAALEFASEDVGFIGGLLGKVWRTTDGGMSWVEIPDAMVGGGTLMDSEYVADIAVSPDGQTVWIIGGTGKCSYSADQGATWSKVEVSIPADTGVTAGAVVGDSVWIVGGVPMEEPTEGSDFEDPTPGNPASDGFVMYSEDGGGSFDTLTSGLEYELTEVSFVNPAEGWASAATFLEGGAAIGITIDGGETWDFVEIDDFPESEVVGINMGASVVPAGCIHVRFYGREVGTAVCTTSTYEFDGSTGLFLTTDGGETWEIQAGYKDAFANQLVAASAVNDVSMADCHRGWLVGAGKIIQRWDNDDADLDCEQGGAPTEETPDDVGDQDGDEAGGGDGGCGCSATGQGAPSLLSLLFSIL